MSSSRMKRRMTNEGPSDYPKRVRGESYSSNDVDSTFTQPLDAVLPQKTSTLHDSDSSIQQPSLPSPSTLADLHIRYAPLLVDRHGHVRAKFISLETTRMEESVDDNDSMDNNDNDHDPWSILSQLQDSYTHSQNAHKLRAVQSYTPQLRVALPDAPGIAHTCGPQAHDALTNILAREIHSMGYRTEAQDVSFYVSFLDTQATELQEAHVDFDWSQVLPKPNEVYTITPPPSSLQDDNNINNNNNNNTQIHNMDNHNIHAPSNPPSSRRRTRATVLPYPYRVPLVAFFPLTSSGMCIEVWEDCFSAGEDPISTTTTPQQQSSLSLSSSSSTTTPSHPGTLVHIPFGCAFLCRGDVVHAGGFAGPAHTGDPRCHLYIYREGGELHAIHQLRNEYYMPTTTNTNHAKPVRMSQIYQHGPEAVAFAKARQQEEEEEEENESDIDDQSDTESMDASVNAASSSHREDSVLPDHDTVEIKQESPLPTPSHLGSHIPDKCTTPAITSTGTNGSPPKKESSFGRLEHYFDKVDSPFMRRHRNVPKSLPVSAEHYHRELDPPLVTPDKEKPIITSPFSSDSHEKLLQHTKRSLLAEIDNNDFDDGDDKKERTMFFSDTVNVLHIIYYLAQMTADFATKMADHLMLHRGAIKKRAIRTSIGFLRLLFRSLYVAFWLLFVFDVIAGWSDSSIVEKASVPFHPHERFRGVSILIFV